MPEKYATIITKRITMPIATAPKAGAIRCLHCGLPTITERAIYCCEGCRDSADDGEPPRIAA